MRARAGFTLIEMMTVVALIGVMAALATPSMLEILRDRATQRDATSFMLVLRDARSRSFGRGAAVRATWDPAGRGVLRLHAALSDIDADSVGDVPSPSCRACDVAGAGCTAFWTQTGVFAQDDARVRESLIELRQTSVTGTLLSTPQSFCFSPQGGTFWSNNGAAYVRMTDVFVFRFSSTRDGTIDDAVALGKVPRELYLSPNGLVRTRL